jgi:hypothetical protein
VLYAFVGADTGATVLTNEWTHLAFVFSNRSSLHHGVIDNIDAAVNEADDIKYSAAVFVNGKREIELSFKDEVLGNNNDLRLFCDGTHPGMVLMIQMKTVLVVECL